jgi:hypothetical protein
MSQVAAVAITEFTCDIAVVSFRLRWAEADSEGNDRRFLHGLCRPAPVRRKRETGALHTQAPTLPGDYNEDCVVGAADHVVWRNHNGTAFDPPNRDPSLMGEIGQADYDFWVANFGTTTGSSADSAAPEPTTAFLALLGWIVMSCCRGPRLHH